MNWSEEQDHIERDPSSAYEWYIRHLKTDTHTSYLEMSDNSVTSVIHDMHVKI